jgi:hypothetical protein
MYSILFYSVLSIYCSILFSGSVLLEESYDSDKDINIGIEFINDVESWEENWLFQKKKLPRTPNPRVTVHHPVPVPMLVPCPGPDQTCRTLIGKIQFNSIQFLFIEHNNSYTRTKVFFPSQY